MNKTMDKKTVLTIVAAALLVVIGVTLLKLNVFRSHKRVVGNCEIEEEEIKMPDATMTGIFQAGEDLVVEKGYYICNSPLPGDTVYYRYSESRNPVVKRIVAVEGDKFKTVKDEKGRGWNLEVNGDRVQGSDGQPYYFGSPNPPTLSLYEKPRNGILNKGETIVFSNQAPGREDSGIFGLVSTGDLLGKVKKR
jgi:signal peptidase I